MKKSGFCDYDYFYDLYGFIDKNGNQVIPYKYRYVEDFSEGLAVVKTYNKPWTFFDNYGFIDKDGNEVIPCEYDHAESFKNGLAHVAKNCCEYFYIDKKRNRVEY